VKPRNTAWLSAAADRRTLVAAALVVVAGVAAYANSLQGAFVFDDSVHVAANPAIRRLWPPYGWLGFSPPRLVVYFTFAVNYALHGTEVAGYHAVNLLIHLATALGLFGVVRRTLRLPRLPQRYRAAADALAGVVAVLWVVHPLGTQGVTYVYQRLESLAALFCVLTLYAFLRAYGESPGPKRGWLVGSVASCYLAMLSKESAFGLPLIILCYDRLFLADGWRGVSARRRYHWANGCSWGVVLGLIFASAGDYEKAGLGSVEGLTPFSYALSQSGVILHYLRLVVWPTGLCLDYAWPVAEHWRQYGPQTIVMLGLLVVTGLGFYRGRTWSFPLVAFFLLLAPTSSIVPIADLAFEHRMYLPSACVLAVAVVGFFEGLEQLQATAFAARHRGLFRSIGPAAAGLFASAFIWGTIDRNRDYVDAPTMWRDILAKAPHNLRHYDPLYCHYLKQIGEAEGRHWVDEVLSRDPENPWALRRKAGLYIDDGRLDEAEACLEKARPNNNSERASCLVEVGRLRAAQGRADEATKNWLAALEVNQRCTAAMTNLSLLLSAEGRWEETAALLHEAIVIDPEFAPAHNSLGTYFARLGRWNEAAAEWRETVRLEPHNAQARSNLGVMLDRLGLANDALAQMQSAVDENPAYAVGFINLGSALARRGRLNEALLQFQRAVELDPKNEAAQANLAQVRADLASSTSAAGARVEP
jgi:tetratricopeptide (TPR) repeat protein